MYLKECTKCKKSIPLTEFYNSKTGKDGLQTQCKACMYVASLEYRKSAEGRKKIREHLQSDKIKKKVKEYNQSSERKIKAKESGGKWRTENPLKRRAQKMIQHRIKTGAIVREPCGVCGGLKVHAHHCDYSKPLEIMWLCPLHHGQWHQENGVGING